MKTSEVLREARNLLVECGWHQGSLIGPHGELCLMGALDRAAPSNHDLSDAFVAIRRSLPPHSHKFVSEWNDDPATTFDDVIDVFDKAEKLAEASEASA